MAEKRRVKADAKSKALSLINGLKTPHKPKQEAELRDEVPTVSLCKKRKREKVPSLAPTPLTD